MQIIYQIILKKKDNENSKLHYIQIHCLVSSAYCTANLKKKEHENSNHHSTIQAWPMHRNALWSDLTIADNIVKKLWIYEKVYVYVYVYVYVCVIINTQVK